MPEEHANSKTLLISRGNKEKVCRYREKYLRISSFFSLDAGRVNPSRIVYCIGSMVIFVTGYVEVFW